MDTVHAPWLPYWQPGRQGRFPLWPTIFWLKAVTILVMPPRIGPKKPVRVYLALWREYLELSQQEVGNRIDPPVDKGTVSRWENAAPGRLTLGVLAAYAEALGRPVADMYRRPPPKDKPAPPSLDAIVGQLDEDARAATIDFVAAMARRRTHAR
jgi:transcriptional regulator with XRE-family HTH domain